MSDAPAWIIPDWPAPQGVRAVSTTRLGGVSEMPYHSLNLGDHVGDTSEAVAENRGRVVEALHLPAMPLWLSQVHGTVVVDASTARPGCEADAAFSNRPGEVCVVMTADCLPVLLCNHSGTQIAAVHAGWRGLADGVIEATVRQLSCPGHDLMAWLGPAIGPHAFEVGDEVRETFVNTDVDMAAAFRPSPAGRWLADLYSLARFRLRALGVNHIYGGHWCTFTDSERFYSYRRDGVTGRMASLIWRE